VAIASDDRTRQYNRTGSQGHWTRGRGHKFPVPLGRKTHYGRNAEKRDTGSDGLQARENPLAKLAVASSGFEAILGKSAVRNFRGGGRNKADGLMACCRAARKGGYIGGHWPNHLRASALLDDSRTTSQQASNAAAHQLPTGPFHSTSRTALHFERPRDFAARVRNSIRPPLANGPTT